MGDDEGNPNGITRRTFLAGGALGVASAVLGYGFGRSTAPVKEITKEIVKEVEVTKDIPFTEWGWPLPYKQVSQESVEWLKDRGWYPLKVGYQPVWVTGGANMFLLKNKADGGLGTFENRGLAADVIPFWAGAPLNEAYLAGEIQAGVYGESPWAAMVDKGAPTVQVGPWDNPGDTSIMVRKDDSDINTVADLGGKVVGVALISCADNAMRIAIMNAGLQPVTRPVENDTEVQLIHMPIPEQITLPKGIDAVCPWAFSPEFMILEAKNAKRLLDINQVYPSCFAHRHIHSDIVKEAPDVAQALVDSQVEADLYMRIHPREASRLFTKYEPFVEAYSEYFIYSQILGQFTKCHPHKQMPFPDLMAQVWGGPVSNFLWEHKRTKRHLKPADWRAQCTDEFMHSAYDTLGWRIPKNCLLLPDGMTNAQQIQMLKDNEAEIATGDKIVKWDTAFSRPFRDPFPIPGDLTEDWYYAGQWYRADELGSIKKTKP